MSDLTDYASLLDQGVQFRLQAKALEEEAKAMKDQANKFFATALDLSGEDKLKHERGTVTRANVSRSSLNKDKLSQALVNKGVQASVVVEAMDEATEVSEYTSITFRESKKSN